MNIALDGYAISKVSSCKYLGVFIDDALNWEDHANYVYSKIIKFVSLFYKFNTNTDTKTISAYIIVCFCLCVH